MQGDRKTDAATVKNVAREVQGVKRRAGNAAVGKGALDALGDLIDSEFFEIHGVPPWLGRFIARMLAKCIALRLPGHPGDDVIEHALTTWCEALMALRIEWNRELDGPRLQKAWRAMLPTLERWPMPADFIRHMPAREYPQVLPPPPLTAEDRERARAILAGISEMLKKRKGIVDDARSNG